MLSRTAENLYWTARYLERADSIVRLLEVAYRISLIPNTKEGYDNEWESILSTSGIKNEYLSIYKEIRKEKIEFFLLFDDRNSSSVKNCIKNAHGKHTSREISHRITFFSMFCNNYNFNCCFIIVL